MKRTQYINIAGKDYPMRFSLGASKMISKKFGSMDKMAEALSAKSDDYEYKVFDSVSYILEVLIKQGCAYKNLFEKDLPTDPGVNPPVVEGKYISLEADDIEVGLDTIDIKGAVEKIFFTISGGNKREVEEKENTSKNVEATQKVNH